VRTSSSFVRHTILWRCPSLNCIFVPARAGLRRTAAARRQPSSHRLKRRHCEEDASEKDASQKDASEVGGKGCGQTICCPLRRYAGVEREVDEARHGCGEEAAGQDRIRREEGRAEEGRSEESGWQGGAAEECRQTVSGKESFGR
jgi:hypothetical protein